MKRMKKRGLLLFAIGMLLPLSGCISSSPSKTNLPYGRSYDASLGTGANSLAFHTDNISYAELSKKIEYQENFLLLVYDYSSLLKGVVDDCACWYGFASGLDQYLQTYQAQIFGINPSDFAKGSNAFGLRFVDGEVTLALFENGKLRSQKTNGNDTLSNLEKIESYLDPFVQWGAFRYLSKAQVDSKLLKNEAFTLGFVRKTCSDCAYLNYHFLKEYGAKAKGTIYLLECDTEGIRLKDGEYAASQWQSFKDEYGLSNLYNTSFGYLTGFVPTFVAYRPNGKEMHFAEAVYDMAVYLNDTLSQNETDVYLSASYWDGSRTHPFLSNYPKLLSNFIGLSIPESDYERYGETYFWKKEAAAAKEDPLLQAFLDTYALEANK